MLYKFVTNLKRHYNRTLNFLLARPFNPIDQSWSEIKAGLPTPPLKPENYEPLLYKALHTIGYFKCSLKQPRLQQHSFAVRVRLTDQQRTIEPWITYPFFENGTINGIISTKCLSKKYKPGTEITLPESCIIDWMMVEDGFLLGGYSIRIGMKNIERYYRKNILDQLPYEIDNGHDHFEHNLTTPEGALLLLGDAIDSRDQDRIRACKDFYREALYLLGTSTSPKIPRPITDEMVQLLERRLEDMFMAVNTMPNTSAFHQAKRSFLYKRPQRMNVWEITEIRTYYNPKFKTLHIINVQETPDGWKVLSNMSDVQLYPRPDNDKGPIMDLTGDHIKFYEDYNFPLFLKNRNKE
ncbi:uncharacterized protein DUF2314 [Chitinophaga dinghuensis]|uniref:Uncharacterized protein DUF2314 n=1 Tax=Chitinophaga dinghuensis TaxID=1539050 RepID=A0A327VY49_9BACT|nr:DUF2314 domain-containing protein [Chitinophaga dinghuensis]RAJ80273.1 uncharacterized protein DUF2314 [Chitinophaga dinghuensis]